MSSGNSETFPVTNDEMEEFQTSDSVKDPTSSREENSLQEEDNTINNRQLANNVGGSILPQAGTSSFMPTLNTGKLNNLQLAENIHHSTKTVHQLAERIEHHTTFNVHVADPRSDIPRLLRRRGAERVENEDEENKEDKHADRTSTKEQTRQSKRPFWNIIACVCLVIFVSVVVNVSLKTFLTTRLTSSADSPHHDKPESELGEESSSPVPCTGDRVVLQALDSQSVSLTGSVCGELRCFSYYDSVIYDIVVTADKRMVLAMYFAKAIVVQSVDGMKIIRLDCNPFGVAQLPTGQLAVTCPDSYTVLLVSLESSHPHIQHIKTEKQYHHVTVHPVNNNTLVVESPHESIDVITLQGELVRRIFFTGDTSISYIAQSTVVGTHLLVIDRISRFVCRINLLGPGPPTLEPVSGTFPYVPHDTAVDKAGNVFVVLHDGSVWVRNSQEDYRQLREGLGDEHSWYGITIHGNRLLKVMNHYKSNKSVVTEYELVNR